MVGYINSRKYATVTYINISEILRKYRTNKCGINWLTLRHKAIMYVKELGLAPSAFKASDGWIANALQRHGKVGINLHGEGNDMTAEEREGIMVDWRVKFHELLEEFSIPPSRVYNGDQTGLYYQKLPNRIYMDKDTKHTHAGVKQMKDKTRVTLMLCTAADGSKVPLAVVGKSKKPMCFREVRNGMPPIPYTN